MKIKAVEINRRKIYMQNDEELIGKLAQKQFKIRNKLTRMRRENRKRWKKTNATNKQRQNIKKLIKKINEWNIEWKI